MEIKLKPPSENPLAVIGSMSDPEPDHISLESEMEEEFAEEVQVDEDSSEEEEEDEDEDDDDDDDDVILPEVTSPRVSPAAVANFVPQTNVCDEEVVMSVSDDTSSQELNRSEIDGLFCPICMEAWTNGGDHQVCCLPCGHIYGLSCIQKWIRQRRGSGKCPQCNRRCTLKEVRLLYASRIVVVDEELRKKVQTLEAKCASLKMKQTECCKKEIEGQRRETELQQQVYQLKKRTSYLEGLLVTAEKRLSGSVPATSGFRGRRIPVTWLPEYRLDSEDGRTGCTSNFVLQVNALKPGTKGHNLTVKVVSSTTVLDKRSVRSSGNTRVAECLIGDDTGSILFTARDEQVDLMKPGATIIIRNSKINMFKGSMRLAVDKWGRIEVTEPAKFDVKEDNNLSLVEYELVNVVEE